MHAMRREADWRLDAGDRWERGLRSMVKHVVAQWGQRGRVQQPGVCTGVDSAPRLGPPWLWVMTEV